MKQKLLKQLEEMLGRVIFVTFCFTASLEAQTNGTLEVPLEALVFATNILAPEKSWSRVVDDDYCHWLALGLVLDRIDHLLSIAVEFTDGNQV